MKTNDLRYIKTEDLIIEAFLYYAGMYGMDDIHIKDICSRARISRNAFYGHYENKYQVLDAVFRMVENRILEEYTPELKKNLSRNSMKDVSKWCARTVRDNRTHLRILSRCSESHFRQLIRNVFINATLSSIYEETGIIHSDTGMYIMESFISDGLTSTIQVWLDHPDEITEEQFADILYEISHDPIEYFYRQLDESGLVKRKRFPAGKTGSASKGTK